MNSFIKALTIEQSDKLIETPVLNTAALQTHLLNMKNENDGSKPVRRGTTGGSALPYIFPTAVSQDQQDEIAGRVEELESRNPDLTERIRKDDNNWTVELTNLFNEMSNDADVVSAMRILNVDLKDAKLLNEVGKAQEDPTFLNAYITGVMKLLSTDKRFADNPKFDPFRQKYASLQQKLIENSYNHNQWTMSALITDTLGKNIAGSGEVDDKYVQNPWLSVFEKPSNAQLNAIDAAALSTLETHLNEPEQDIIIRSLFGDSKEILANTLKNNAASSYKWIIENFPEQVSAVETAKRQTNYTKEGSPVTTIPGGWFDRNINITGDAAYSIRDNTASGLYGKLKIVSVDGFSPVLDEKKGTSDQYTFRLTVKVPLENIQKDIANKYYTWDENDADASMLSEATGLHTEIEDGIEYVHVPIFINRQLNSNTKGLMDAFYRKKIDSSTDLDKANEEQLSLSNPAALSF